MEPHGWEGIGKVFSSPNGAVVHDFVLVQVGHEVQNFQVS
jgi:hypothetical protein